MFLSQEASLRRHVQPRRQRHTPSKTGSSNTQTFLSAASAWLLAVLALSCVAQSTLARAAPAGKVEMHAGQSLNSENWESMVSEGIWLVEHYSPYCHHCKDFAPTWIKLVSEKEAAYKSIDTHFGQVDCSVQGDLCDSNDVKGYPSIFLYENGKFVEQFKKERTMDKLTKWLDARLPDLPVSGSSDTEAGEDPVPVGLPGDAAAQTYADQGLNTASPDQASSVGSETVETVAGTLAKTGATAAPALLQVQKMNTVQKRVQPNADGKVLSVQSAAQLESLLDPATAPGPAFVKYYAPWCGHCKKLAPTWSELAGVLKDKVNVIDFNCDLSENKPKCRKEGINGYPTLVFYNTGERAEYQGGRSLEQLEAYASKAALATGMQEVTEAGFNKIVQQDDVVFLYLHPKTTPQSDIDIVHAASRTLLGHPSVLMSDSANVFRQLDHPSTHPALFVFKDRQASPVASYNFDASHSTSTDAQQDKERRKELTDEVTRWMGANKLPTLAELGRPNFKDYFEEGQRKNPSYVVVAALSPNRLGQAALEEKTQVLKNIAGAWRAALRHTPRPKPVNFIWVDLDRWGKFLSSNYGISPSQSESIAIIVDPINEVFYPLDAERSTIKIEGRQIFSTLESLYEGKLRAISSTTTTDKIGKFLIHRLGFIVTAIGDHPFLAIFFGLFLVVVFFAVLVYIMDADEGNSHAPTHQPKSVNNGSTLYKPTTSPSVKKD